MTYRTTTAWSAWKYSDPTWETADLGGFTVEALDGEIGKVDNATMDTGQSYLVVDTGPWIFGKKVMLPAGVVSRIDQSGRRIFVNRTKEQIKNAPEFDDSYIGDTGYFDRVGTYYAEGSPGWRDPVYQ
jgi:hypothetical protein